MKSEKYISPLAVKFPVHFGNSFAAPKVSWHPKMGEAFPCLCNGQAWSHIEIIQCKSCTCCSFPQPKLKQKTVTWDKMLIASWTKWYQGRQTQVKQYLFVFQVSQSKTELSGHNESYMKKHTYQIEDRLTLWRKSDEHQHKKVGGKSNDTWNVKELVSYLTSPV